MNEKADIMQLLYYKISLYKQEIKEGHYHDPYYILDELTLLLNKCSVSSEQYKLLEDSIADVADEYWSW